ncbi:MAG: hypothetical protein IJP03_04670 [Christensenellaceae bacterium]|nr:hypothetical protein [Christensenellaceae bacterium]
MTSKDLLGLPLQTALDRLKEEGISWEITQYRAKRELENADDLRVLRCDIAPGHARLIVSAFSTEIPSQAGESIEA